jgi:hypothetical protein
MAIYTGRSYTRGFRLRDANGAPAPLSGAYQMHFRKIGEPPPSVVFSLTIDAAPGRLVLNLPHDHGLTAGDWLWEIVSVDTFTRLCGGRVPVRESI